MHNCPWTTANISHPQHPVKVSSTAARQRATSHQPPTMLPTRESTRNCLLRASRDFAALSPNAPARLSQRKSSVALVIPHTETTSTAGSPPSTGSGARGVRPSQGFLLLPAPTGPPHCPQLTAASPHHWFKYTAPPTGSEESPALHHCFGAVSVPQAEYKVASAVPAGVAEEEVGETGAIPRAHLVPQSC